MLELVAGAVGGVTASSLFSVGLLLQAAEGRATPASEVDGVRLVLRLVHRPRWVLGGLAMVVAFTLHVGALMLAPLTVVQPCLAAGLLILLIAGTGDDELRVGAREVGGVVALTLGLVALTITAPQRTVVSAEAIALALALTALGAMALVAHVPGWGRETRSILATVGAGAAYALTGITTKLASDRLAESDLFGATLWMLVTAISAALALVNQTVALRDRPPTEVGVFLYLMPVLIPVVLAPVLVGESWSTSPGGGLPLGLSIVAVCAGAMALGGSRHVRVV